MHHGRMGWATADACHQAVLGRYGIIIDGVPAPPRSLVARSLTLERPSALAAGSP